MSTITIETGGSTSKRYVIDLSKESKELVREIRKLVEARSKAPGLFDEPTAKLKRAAAYIDEISDRPESRSALAEADAMRKSWIRKYERVRAGRY